MSSLKSYGTSYLHLALGIYGRLFSFGRENRHIASESYANEHNCELQVGIAGLRLIRGETQGRFLNSELPNPLPKKSLPDCHGIFERSWTQKSKAR
eukprot:scaffold20678_cov69-Cyclotella_meneghiniana.AAC.1